MAAENPTVLVTDGEQRAALAIVRSLGRAGYVCMVTSSSGRSLTGGSRYARREIVLPDPSADPTRYATAVQDAVRSMAIDLLLPVTEASLLALLPFKDRIEAVIPFADLDVFRKICDKAAVLETAESLGIRVPAQYMARSPGDPELSRVSFPVVLKPTRSVVASEDGTRVKVGVSWVYSEADLRPVLQRYPPDAFPLMAQEVVHGPGIGVFLLVHGGQVLASFAHRRIREKPPSGGVSVLRQSETMDPKLLEQSVALLDKLRWSGVAMVEYKRDEDSGDAVLMEINGRFWGSLQLAIDAGVDFPRLLADISLGRAIQRGGEYAFVRNRWFWGDVDHVLAVWRDDRASWKDRFGACLGWLRALGPGYRSDVFRWTDPLPFIRESTIWFRNLIG